MKEKFLKLLGHVPQDKDPFVTHRRIHQGWWRTAVLLEDEGPHPIDPSQTVCNTFALGPENQTSNYLAPEAACTVRDEIILRRQGNCSGIIQEPRIWNNLLSSQPLAFNFWGPLKSNPQLTNRLLPLLIPDFGELSEIRFEWAPQPKEDFTNDHSAFDVMVAYRRKDHALCILGLECKYTDKLNSKEFSSDRYQQVFQSSRSVFARDYEHYLQPQFNQLFRNQLMAEAIHQKQGILCQCGLFCSQRDESALAIAQEYAASLNGENAPFLVITYERFIEELQRLEVDWRIREWSMMLWARYLGLSLSQRALEASGQC